LGGFWKKKKKKKKEEKSWKKTLETTRNF